MENFTRNFESFIKYGVLSVMNIITATDSYKLSHYLMYPEKTEQIYSYLESEAVNFQVLSFLGFNTCLEYLSGKIITEEKIDDAERISKYHFSSDKIFNREGWEYILDE